MPPRVGQRAHVSDTTPKGRMAPNTPTQPPRPKTPDATTGPTDHPVREPKAGPPKAAEEFRSSEMPPNQKAANPLRATISDLNDPDRDE